VQQVHHFPSASPWRAATVVVGVVALVELVALLVVAGVRLAPSRHAVAKTAPAPKAAATKPAVRVPLAPTHPLRPRRKVRVLILNGNGVSGAAADAAQRLEVEGYRIGGAANARRHDYAKSMVMFAPGWAKEARRLARDAGVPLVTPLDGVKTTELKGSKIVLLLGT
jgi:LytR cell envelope-related transcriptional attenuator